MGRVTGSVSELQVDLDHLGRDNVRLRNLDEELANVFAHLDVGIVLVDMERRLVQFNPRMQPIMWLTPTDTGRPIGELRGTTRIPDLDTTIARVIETRVVHERDIRTADHHAYRMRIAPYFVDGDRMAGAMITFIDVSALVRSIEAEREARLSAHAASERQRNAFLSTLSDELRTPLTAILLWTDVLRDLEHDDPRRELAIETIAESSRAEARLIDELLDLAMSATGELVIDAAVIDPVPIIHRAVKEARELAREKDVRVLAAIDNRDCSVYADARRVQQIVTKLLVNAVDFTPPGGTVHLTFSDAGELCVSDQGPGIDPAFLPHVFEPFAQQDPSKSRAHRGLGIGLALVRHLVERQGGTIEVRSTVGQGSTFVVQFPITS